MRTQQAVLRHGVLALLCGMVLALPATAQSELPAGARIEVQLDRPIFFRPRR